MSKKKDSKKIEELEDITFEEDVDLEYQDESLCKDKMKKLREKLKICEKEKQEYLDGWQRMKADSINEKKRLIEQVDKAKTLGKVEAIETIIPVLDSFEMAFKGDAWTKVDEIWKQGVEYIHKQFESALEALGVSSFAKEGENFDPQIHESIKEVKTNDKLKDNKIAKVLRQGYRNKDLIIRPAQVEVFVYKNK
jgi:molecular chaperone GrpE